MKINYEFFKIRSIMKKNKKKTYGIGSGNGKGNGAIILFRFNNDNKNNRSIRFFCLPASTSCNDNNNVTIIIAMNRMYTKRIFFVSVFRVFVCV